jgi:hypothetical protein
MTQPTIRVLGAYKVEITNEEIREFLRENSGNMLTLRKLEEQIVLKQEELSSVASLDVSVANADVDFDIANFRQPDTDQVACDEVYLSTDGRSIESRTKPNDPNNFRVYFFLHFHDKNKPLLTAMAW